MHKVFINYRTGDGDEAAALVANALSHRFGRERIFLAGDSIPPGTPFPERLLDAVRSSTALLAIIGPDWPQNSRLHDEDDWVRREITEAFTHGALVIPVLKGRKTDRLSKRDLPPDLVGLADVQYLRLDTRETADVIRIGDELARLIPEFAEIDRTGVVSSEARTSRNPADTAPGTSRPSDAVPGRTGPLVTGTRGNVHTGKGDINDGSPHFSGDGTRYIEGDVHGDVN